MDTISPDTTRARLTKSARNVKAAAADLWAEYLGAEFVMDVFAVSDVRQAKQVLEQILKYHEDVSRAD